MTLRRQLNLIVLTVVSLCAAVLFLGLEGISFSALQEIEVSLAKQDLRRVEGAYHRELEEMDRLARDWAWWDDACHFVATTNPAFITANLNYETIQQLDMDYLGFARLTGEVVYGVRHDRENETLVAWPAPFLEYLQNDRPLLSFRNPQDKVSGLVVLPEGVALVVARHILRSDGSLPPPPFGAFIMARMLDEKKMAEWCRLLDLNIEWHAGEEAVLPRDVFDTGEKGGKPSSCGRDVEIEKSRVTGCVELRDLYNQRVGCLRMTKPCTSRVLMAQMAVVLLSLIGAMSAVVTWAAGRYVVRPVTDLSAEIERIATEPNLQARVHQPKEVELSAISGAVNHLLSAISVAEKKRERSIRFIQQLNEYLLQFGPNTNANIGSLVQLLGELLNADYAVYRGLKGSLVRTIAQWRAPDDLPQEDVAEGHLCYDAIRREGEGLFVVRDLQHSSYAASDPDVRKYALQTYMGHPVVCAGQVVGAVSVFFRRAVEPTAEERDFVGIVASAIGVEEDRAAAENRLKESQEEWRKTFDFIPDAICFFDKQFRIQRVNASMAKLLGMSPEEIIGQTCYECVHGTDAPHPQCPHARSFLTGREESAEIVEEKLGGEFYVTCTPVYDAHGQIVGSIHVARDIHELKEKERRIRELLAESEQARLALLSLLEDARRMEEELCRSEARFRDLVTLLPGIVWEADAEGRFTFLNEFGLRELGYTPDDLKKGITIYDVVVPEQHEAIRKNMLSRISGFRGATEYTLRRKDGSTFPVATYTMPIMHGGQLAGWRGIGVDITERKHIEDLRVSKEAAEHASRAKSELLAVMSHELRTPVHAIIGFARAALDGVYGPMSDPIREIFRQTLDGGEELIGLITDLLDMARLDLGKMELSLGEVNVSRIVQDAVRLIRGREDAAWLKFETAFTRETENLRILADERRVKQILLNLLSNSVKFTPPEGWVRVDVGLQNESQRVRISVTDSGPGVTSENLERIFERFERVQPADGRWREGVGLGLALAKELTELHGGRIWAEPGDDGVGLRVIFELPVNGPPSRKA